MILNVTHSPIVVYKVQITSSCQEDKMHSYIKLNQSLHVKQFIGNLHLEEHQDFLVLDINVRDK